MKQNELIPIGISQLPSQWIKPACSWNITIFKTEVFFQNWSIVSDADFSWARWELFGLFLFSQIPAIKQLIVAMILHRKWASQLNSLCHLLALPGRVLQPRPRLEYSAQRDSGSFDLCPLLRRGMAEGAGVPDSSYQWKDHWIQRVKGEKHSSCCGRETWPLWSHVQSLEWDWQPDHAKERKRHRGSDGTAARGCDLPFACHTGKAEKRSHHYFSWVHSSVISSAGCVCECVCVKDNRKKHLVWLHSSHLLIMSLKAIVSDNLCF